MAKTIFGKLEAGTMAYSSRCEWKESPLDELSEGILKMAKHRETRHDGGFGECCRLNPDAMFKTLQQGAS